MVQVCFAILERLWVIVFFLSKKLKYEVNCPKRIILQRLNASVKPMSMKRSEGASYDLEGSVGEDSFEVCFNQYYTFSTKMRTIKVNLAGKLTERNGKTYIDIKVKQPLLLYAIFIPLCIFTIINCCFTYITQHKILESLPPILTIIFAFPLFVFLMKDQADNALKVLEKIFKECDGLCLL